MREVNWVNSSELINRIKKYSVELVTKELNKKVYDIYELDEDRYMLGVIANELIDVNQYETYIYVSDKKEILCNILYKKITSEEESRNHYSKLKELIILNDLSLLLDECSK